jgi:hypothetical protein
MVQPPMAQDDLYARANRINAKLASKFDSALASEGRQIAQALIAEVQSKVEDYPDFVRRVDRSEEFSLHESAQVEKDEQQLKLLYVRAVDLLETIKESESRANKQR